jgi:hypothetical protein
MKPLKKNSNCDFTIAVIDNKQKKPEIIKQDNLLYIKLSVDRPEKADWTHQFLNWNGIFLDTEKNI